MQESPNGAAGHVMPDVTEPGGDAIIVCTGQSVVLLNGREVDIERRSPQSSGASEDVLEREPIPVDARGERRVACYTGGGWLILL